jgi:hypothetical protein
VGVVFGSADEPPFSAGEDAPDPLRCYAVFITCDRWIAAERRYADKALRRPFEIIDGWGNTGGIDLGVVDAVLGVSAPVEDAPRPTGQR